MDRLTEKSIGCFEFGLKDHEHVAGEFATYEAFYNYSTAVKRLGQYEDTGLTPGEITSLQEALGGKEVADWAVEAVGCRKEAIAANQARLRLEKEVERLQASLAEAAGALEAAREAYRYSGITADYPLNRLIGLLDKRREECQNDLDYDYWLAAKRKLIDSAKAVEDALHSPAAKDAGERWRALIKAAKAVIKYRGVDEYIALNDALEAYGERAVSIYEGVKGDG